MFALTSFPYVYPYGFIVGPLMIAALLISMALFAKYRSWRKSVLSCTGALALFEILFLLGIFGEGAFIGFITLTCVGLMASLHFIKAFGFRIFAGLSFAVLGCLEFMLPFEFMQKATVSFQYLMNLTWFVLMISLALTTLAGGLLILFSAFKKRDAA